MERCWFDGKGIKKNQFFCGGVGGILQNHSFVKLIFLSSILPREANHMITCDCGQQFKKEANHKVHLRTKKHRIQLAKKHGVPIPSPLESVPTKKIEETDKVVQHMETAVKVLNNAKDIYQEVQEKIEQSKNKPLMENIEAFLTLGLKWINKLK